MEKLSTRVVGAQVAATMYIAGAFDRLKRDDRGQGSAEYMGIIIVVIALVAVVLAAATPIGEAIKGKILAAIASIGG